MFQSAWAELETIFENLKKMNPGMKLHMLTLVVLVYLHHMTLG